VPGAAPKTVHSRRIGAQDLELAAYPGIEAKARSRNADLAAGQSPVATLTGEVRKGAALPDAVSVYHAGGFAAGMIDRYFLLIDRTYAVRVRERRSLSRDPFFPATASGEAARAGGKIEVLGGLAALQTARLVATA
jgi:hypothetical protein